MSILVGQNDLHFSIFFWSKVFQKNELLFSFFVRIMRAIISSLLLCLWKIPCLNRNKSVYSSDFPSSDISSSDCKFHESQVLRRQVRLFSYLKPLRRRFGLWDGLWSFFSKCVYLVILKKSLYFFIFFFSDFFFKKNELRLSGFNRIMKYIFCFIALVFLKNTVVKKKTQSRFYMEILKKTLYFFIFFRIFSRNENHNSNEKW